MSRVGFVAVVASLALATPVLAASPPDASALARRMKAALEPDRPSIRRMTLTIDADEGATVLTLGQARKHLPDGDRVLTVVLAPPDRRGVALLTRALPNRGAVEEQVWVPAVRRVRTILPVEGLTPFLDSDFTLADLGFVDLRSHFQLVGPTLRDGTALWEIGEVPQSPHARWYYSRVRTWLRQDTGLPVERRYYDPSGTLWKDERFEQVSVVDGVPTVLAVRMRDELAGGSSELRVDLVSYDADLPDALFDPKGLRDAVDSPVWSAGGSARLTGAEG
jgi:hypothetical protein